jgi:lipopolysaccharide export system protein LptA
MKKLSLQKLNRFSISLLFLFVTPALHALSTDKDQDVEINSDTVVIDDRKNVSVYTGSVIVVQGSLRITGDVMTVFYTQDLELDKIIVEGKIATFRQLPDDSSTYDEAEAQVIEYHKTDGLIILTGNVFVSHDTGELTAGRIEYDTELNQVRVKSSDSESNSGDNRVKVIIPADKAGSLPGN